MTMRDGDDQEVRVGDVIAFSYGVPGQHVEARVVEQNGNLVALTPGHAPRKCRLDKLGSYVGEFYKLRPDLPTPPHTGKE